jgi:four helix bundle protein
VSDLYFQRLDVYRVAARFALLSSQIAHALPRGEAHLRDQLLRASSSIAFNIAEGAGETAPRDKARFYRIARRSATESAAILDLAAGLGVAEPAAVSEVKELVVRVVMMLTKLIKRFETWDGEGRDRARIPEPEPEPFTGPGRDSKGNQ